jgi:hypothetical protein
MPLSANKGATSGKNMRQDETNSLLRMKLIHSLSAADTASRGPLTYEDGVCQSDLKARVGGRAFFFLRAAYVII